MCFHSTCVARAAGKPTPFPGGAGCCTPSWKSHPFPGGAGCELPHSQLEIWALAKLGGLQAPSVCQVGPLMAQAQATALGLWPNSRGGDNVVQPRSRLSRCRTRILCSAGAPQAPRPALSPLQPSQPSGAGGGELSCARIWAGDKRGRCFSSPKANAHAGSLALAQG